jgi:hypothetical protein
MPRRLVERKESHIEEGVSDAGSCAHDDIGSSEACGITGNRLHQREERAIHVARRHSERTWNFIGRHCLGPGLLRFNRGPRGGSDTRILSSQEHEDHRIDQMNLM